MKHKTADLTGALLNAAVALAAGMKLVDRMPNGRAGPWYYVESGAYHVLASDYRPSTDWHQGGYFIEREHIAIVPNYKETWGAHHEGGIYGYDGHVESLTGDGEGPTPLIAAMRAYVAAKLGPEIDLP